MAGQEDSNGCINYEGKVDQKSTWEPTVVLSKTMSVLSGSCQAESSGVLGKTWADLT